MFHVAHASMGGRFTGHQGKPNSAFKKIGFSVQNPAPQDARAS
jgi:hypothetical protein